MKFHKNFHLVALFATMIALNAQATPVLPAQARRAVSAWAAANGSAFANPGTAVSAAPEYDADGTTVLYYKVKMSNGGLVIASPDTDLDLVVAVLENSDGTFPKGHPLPSILKADMRKRLSVIAGGVSSASVRLMSVSPMSASSQASAANLPADVKASIKAANAQWEKYGNANAMRSQSSVSDESIAPYVRKVVAGFERGGKFTHWNQSNGLGGKLCYNYYTPKNEVCGCVATAGAAIMQFFGCVSDIDERGPLDGLQTYLYGSVYPKNTIAGEIDWSGMANVTNIVDAIYEVGADGNLNITKPGVYLLDDAGRELAGRITCNLGVLAGMKWAENGPGEDSSAYLSNLAAALKAYGFDSARYVIFPDEVEDASRFFKMIYAQNWAGAPVALGILGEKVSDDEDPPGHAVIACGYAKTADDEEYCRVFMGYGGDGDAWYNFPKVSPYSIIQDAITMIGYDLSQTMDPMDVIGLGDDEINDIFNKYGTVPVCGRVNITNANVVLEFPGVSRSAGEGEDARTFTLTAKVDENGFFAVRIPAGTENLSIVHADSGATMQISPFNSAVLKDEKAQLSALEDATPAELAFIILNMTIKPTVQSAYATALRDGKALLMLSGGGSTRDNMLVDYLTYLDSTEDMASKFVMVRVSSSDPIYGDGNPSIGVFDPSTGSAEGRWWDGNGRLSYCNFIDIDGDNLDSIQYVDASVLSNNVVKVLDDGYNKYLRLHSGISVAVRAVDDAGRVLEGLGGDSLSLAYGVYTNCWTNGQVQVFAAPEKCTNSVLGVSYKCVGWSTNAADTVGSAVASCLVELSIVESVDFAWIWKIDEYRVSASSYPVDGAVTPAETWRVPGDRVTLTAAPAVGESNLYGFNYWDASDVSGASCDLADYGDFENGNCLSFTVAEPLCVVAKYKEGRPAASLPYTTNTVEVSVNNADLAQFIENGGSLSLGSNTTFDNCASIVAMTSEIVDSTGGVWKCTGYVVGGVTNSLGNGLIEEFDPSGNTSIELVWELQAPEEEPPAEPGPISIKALSRSANGEWSIAVEGAIKGCFYTLYAADDISKLAGPSNEWSAGKAETLGDNPLQATEDGEIIVFKMAPTASAQFWRVKASGNSE